MRPLKPGVANVGDSSDDEHDVRGPRDQLIPPADGAGERTAATKQRNQDGDGHLAADPNAGREDV